jgi:hypothetical protein
VASTLTLRDLIESAGSLSWTDWIYVERGEITLETAVAFKRARTQELPASMRSFLSVGDFQDILSAWSQAREGRRPTLTQALLAITFYEVNDAFMPPEHDP